MADIFALIDHAAKEIRKKRNIVGMPSKYDKTFQTEAYYESLPEFTEIYPFTIREHNAVCVHAEANQFPYEILRSKAPNQQPEEWEYQKGLYEPTTNTEWNRALNRTKAVANSQNYSIEWPNDEQKEYFYGLYPEYYSIEAYFFDIVRERKINYPNQLLLVCPEYLPMKTAIDEEGNEYEVVDQSELISPVAKIYQEKYIAGYKAGEYALLWNGKDGDKMGFKYVDKLSIYEAYVNGKDAKGNLTFEVVEVFRHGWGYLPAWKLGGKPEMKDGEVLYRSAFADAIPHLNTVIRLESNLMMSTYRLAFPIIIAVVDRCDAAGCDGGQVWNNESNGYSACGKCNGTGKNLNHSPTGIYEVAATTRMGETNQLAMSPPVQFAAPPSEILKYTSDQIEARRRSAFGMFFEPEQANSATATGKQIEKEEWQTFMVQFARELFALMDMSIEAIGHMRYGNAFEKPSIQVPTSFNFRSYEDITTEIGTAKEQSMPDSALASLLYQYVGTRFNASPKVERMIKLQIKLDRLWSKDDLTVRGMLGSTATEAEVILHNSFVTILNQAYDENENFDEFETAQQREIVLGIATSIAEPFMPKQIDGQAMLGGTELSKTVGGLTGFIEIAKAVASGVYDLEAAISFVTRMYGISEEQARRELGTPQLPNSDEGLNLA
jgi:hypothetical protein